MAGLTTHVLDVVQGRPAHGVRVQLFRFDERDWISVRETRTNADGRTDHAMLAPEEARMSLYELRFHVGEYFSKSGVVNDGARPFLDVVPVRFAISEPDQHYHVPLLVSPWSYTTYRGS